MATVLVTGGAGFLGSHLCDRLIERGDEVICVDNFFTGTKENVRHLIGHPRFELIRHDIVHPLYVEADRIFNLACPASPQAYQFNPIKTIKTSTVGMVNVMGLAKRCGTSAACVDVGGLWRSAGSSADGRLLGTRQPDWASQLLRRRQTHRRIADDELPRSSWRGNPHHPNLQHIRTTNGSGRRSSRVELHHAGFEGRRHHCLWRWLTDAVILLL